MRLSVLGVACGLVALLAAAAPASVLADTPASCPYDAFLGTWVYSIGAPMSPPSGLSVDCDNFQTATSMQVVLSYPNIATVAGRPDLPAGNWTTVATQGVDVWLNGTISFAFSAWDPATKASVCDKSIAGSMISLDGSQWRCFQMTKVAGEKLKHPVEDAKPIVRNNISPEERAIRAEKRAAQLLADPLRKTRTFKTDHKFLAKVNAAQSLFTVKHYPEFDGMSIGELERMRGLVVEDGDVAPLEEIAPSNSLHAPRLAAKDVPASFDWRNVSGVNFVSPVRSQGSCGSCYAFASAGMMEARIRVRSNNKQQPILSPQDVVSCSNYAQGCEGGFAYLIGGKYARDFGMAEEACYPYTAQDSSCAPSPAAGCNPRRWKSLQYYYVGGYKWQATEQLMKEELMANGPMAVSMFVFDDFHAYAGGVYTHSFTEAAGLEDQNNKFMQTNHAVLMVGWGVTDDANQTPYWIVKNSWGPTWGESGYFRILRGLPEPGGECAIETTPFSAIPIV